MFTITIKIIKHSDLYNSLYTNSYTYGIQQTDIYMLIYVNQTNGEN